ncbi:MAG: toxic anion resistance protein [Peptococcaceae bacterium]|nr:toxic anion resistance protein [Peptococcaceae bacterium]
MTEKIQLTLGEETESPLKDLQAIAAQADRLPAAENPPTPKAVLDMSSLTPEEQVQVRDFAEKIDLSNATQILQYGAGAQKKISNFSEAALSSVRTKDLGEVGDMITDLVVELKGFDVDEESKGIFGFFKKGVNKLEGLKAKYDKAEVNVDKICGILENHQIQLMKDIAMLDQMYDTNLVYLKELAMYILAGKKRLEEARATTLPKLLEKATESGLPEEAQAANDFAGLCDRFEKKVHDLELTRMVSIQMAPQIRLIQNNDSLMAEKIQTSLVNTIPLWKSQMVLALGLAHSQSAMEAQREVSQMTNELLRKNSEKLKMGTIETAKESERGIVDIETLKKTNQNLIETLDEVVKIQNEGRIRRRQAEDELGRIEGQLKQKLLEVNKGK